MFHKEKNNIYRARNTVIEMLRDRGYDVPEEKYNISFTDFLLLYQESNYDIIANHTDDAKKQIYAKFAGEIVKFGKKNLQKIVENIRKEHNDNINIVILIGDKINTSIANELKNDEYKNVQIFILNLMITNKTHHSFVPQHIPLNEEEQEKVLKKYKLKLHQFQKIDVDDPIAKYYDLKRGQLCKIIRTSQSSGNIVAYRVGI